MTPGQLCGGKTRAGTDCGRPKGWGTDHPGAGRCKFHGGSSPTGRTSAYRQSLMAEARAWAGDVQGDSSELIMAAANCLSAQAALADRHLTANDGDPVWHKIALETAKAAHDAHAKIIALGLEERRQRWAERDAAPIAAAALDALRAALSEALTPEIQQRFAEVFEAQLSVHEHRGEVLELPSAA